MGVKTSPHVILNSAQRAPTYHSEFLEESRRRSTTLLPSPPYGRFASRPSHTPHVSSRMREPIPLHLFPFPLDGGRLEPALVKTGDGGEPSPDNILPRSNCSRTVHPSPPPYPRACGDPSPLPPPVGATLVVARPPTHPSLPRIACPREDSRRESILSPSVSSRMRGPIPSSLPRMGGSRTAHPASHPPPLPSPHCRKSPHPATLPQRTNAH